MTLTIARVTLAIMISLVGASQAFCQEKSPPGKARNFKNQKLAIVGDSITERLVYSKYLETYLRVTNPDAKMKIIQYGWTGEKASDFLRRMDNDVVSWKPGIVTVCYGMNDGGVVKYNDDIGSSYEKNMRAIVKKLSDFGTQVFVASPGVVDSDTFKRPTVTASDYNENLDRLAGIARKIASEFNMSYVDVNGVMMKSMMVAKTALGNSYSIGVLDGVHYDPNGHLLMTYAFLKAMGVDGNIGKINMDFKSGKAEATEGHKILKGESGKAKIQSSKYPFCFESGPKSPASILPFVPFQEDLNRLTLVVTNLPSDKAEIIWGDAKKTFTKKQLEKGVNLAAEFVDDNPFKKPFFEVMANIQKKQTFEIALTRLVLTNIPNLDNIFKDDKEIEDAKNVIRKKMYERDEQLQQKVISSVKPVIHEISILPLK